MAEGNSTNIITTEDASLRTVAVEIKVIQVNNKQMTLSVFRQLPIGETQQVIKAHEHDGVKVWGRVNYFWPDCCIRGDHIHVVFSRGGILYRAGVAAVSFEQSGEEFEDYDQEDDEEIQQLRTCQILGDPAFIDQVEQWCNESDRSYHRRSTNLLTDLYLAQKAIAIVRTRVEKWNERVSQLKGLPQLFIAL